MAAEGVSTVGLALEIATQIFPGWWVSGWVGAGRWRGLCQPAGADRFPAALHASLGSPRPSLLDAARQRRADAWRPFLLSFLLQAALWCWLA